MSDSDRGARVCACGCGASLEGWRANAMYFTGACRVRAYRNRQKVAQLPGRDEGDVTLGEALPRLKVAASEAVAP